MAEKAQMQNQQNQQEQPKVLRIGMIKEGKVVKEVVTRLGESVTVGDSPRDTFELKVKGVKSFTLFAAAKNGAYTLHFTEKMDGRISVKDAVASLEDLRKKGQAARAKGDNWAMALDEKNRGRVSIGDATFLFQFVPMPLESMRSMTGRKDFKPALIDEEDFVFYGFLGVFSIAAAILMGVIFNTEPKELTSIEDIPEQYVELIIPKVEEVEQQSENPEEKVEKKEDKKEEKKEDDKPKKELTAEEKAAAEAARQQKLREDVLKQSKLLVGILGSRGENAANGEVEDVFSQNDGLAGKLEDALANVGSADVANAGNLGVKGATGGGRGDATIGDLAAGGGGSANVGSGPATKLRAKSDLGAIEAVGGDADQVKSTVAKYGGGIKACYETRLKDNPTLSGRLAIAVSISGGRVTSVTIDENTTNDKAMESCVVAKVRSWRFPEGLPQMDIYLPYILSASN